MNLLVADPHLDNSEWVKELKNRDFTLNVVENGEEVIAAIQSQAGEYDAVLVNGILPDILGHKLASFIKKIYPDLSVFVVTRETNMEVWREVSKCKAQLLPLPIDIERLLFILNKQQPKDTLMNLAQVEVATTNENENNANNQITESNQEQSIEDYSQETNEDLEPLENIPPQELKELKRRRNKRDIHEGKVISLYSWKGGVGKTTTAVNLATIIQTYCDKSVCIVELTRQAGNILSHFALIPTVTLKTWIEKKPNKNNAMINLLEDPVTGLYILPSQTLLDYSYSPIKITIREALNIIKILKEIFDVVVIDAGTILDDFQIAIFQESDHIILVSDLTFETLKENHYMPEIFKKKNIDLEKVIHVINKVDKGFGVSVKDAIEIVAIPTALTLSYRKQMMKKKEKREPFVLTYDRDKYTTELKTLINFLFPENERLQSKKAWWKKFIG